ncbi:MAG: cytochrome c [Planctomycetaceae bacterium]|jgi:mono/diheme cytochrome c family protein|nr:cytochrome c [Planctomycetaceae bacterium]MBT6155984.1 cytochrome c [Planctomycetaceae bacterium]MBT6483499.1 cytochrome c [Planctomycetaceae bacterium]MBT6494690.1 cytochrome c [Planctomycetaceae bacterium]
MLGRLNILLALLLVVVAVLTASIGVDQSQPNLEFLPEMKYSPAWTAFEENPNFPNGRTLQAPPAGTIARGDELPLYFVATKEDAVRAGKELPNPYSAEPETKKQQAEAAEELRESIQRGDERYRIFCVSCHGAKGAGDGPVAKRGFPPPPSLLTGKSPQMKDGQLFHILTYGQGNMAPFAAQLTRESRWDAINYIRDMQAKIPKPTEPPAESKQPEKKQQGERPE